ncbi:orotidine 5'-phosphate decarboxylase [Candidatus Saccharibacteria bacterium]|nr:orotidine 5'-phosphate decarboxylase [Candidatus Saccharibacteria bacterium]
MTGCFFEKYPERELIELLQKNDHPVFVDAKIAEIPDKVLKIADLYLKHSPAMLNIMAGDCSTGIMQLNDSRTGGDVRKLDLLRRFAGACRDAGTQSCAVTVLTSKTEAMVWGEYHTDPMSKVLEYAKMMETAGMTDIVCSPMEAEAVSENCKLTINTPGIRLPDTDTRDQARIMTPKKAFEAHADRLVIGSNLTDGEGTIVERIERNLERLVQHIENDVGDDD